MPGFNALFVDIVARKSKVLPVGWKILFSRTISRACFPGKKITLTRIDLYQLIAEQPLTCNGRIAVRLPEGCLIQNQIRGRAKRCDIDDFYGVVFAFSICVLSAWRVPANIFDTEPRKGLGGERRIRRYTDLQAIHPSDE